MGIVKEIVDLVDILSPAIKRIVHSRRQKTTGGVVPRSAAIKKKRLKNEVFAAELLTRDIVIENDDSTVVHIDRRDVTDVVISSDGKKALCEEFVTPCQKALRKRDDEYHKFLMAPKGKSSKNVDLNDLPLRWASGGVLSIVTYQYKKWIPLFFRDIRPYGWNVSLGSSERYFDEKGMVISNLDEELNNPLQFIAREFLEETLVLTRSPTSGSNESKLFILPFWPGSDSEQKKLQFASTHIELREKYDHLRIRPNHDARIRAHAAPTQMTLRVESYSRSNPGVSDVIICFNLLELGIEVVKVITYDLDDYNYLLDGEILEFTPKELTRMPVGLISVSYLQSVFGTEKADLTYTLGPQPSVRVRKPIPQEDIHIFDWDILQRLAIIRGEKDPIGTELRRYLDWYDKFGPNFLDEQDSPWTGNPSRLFTPATVKLLNLCFSQIDSKVFAESCCT